MAFDEDLTLVDAVRILRREGFTCDFKFEEGKMVSCDSNVAYRPEEMKIIKVFRLEGASNPSDMSIVFAVETNRDEQGIIISSYGVYADMELIEFLNEVKVKVQQQKDQAIA